MPKAFFNEETGSVCYRCPGCKQAHCVPAERWNWNRDVERPTLSPSVRHFWKYSDIGRPDETTCHYFVREGQIEYCGDCKHELAGKTVPLPEWTGFGE